MSKRKSVADSFTDQLGQAQADEQPRRKRQSRAETMLSAAKTGSGEQRRLMVYLDQDLFDEWTAFCKEQGVPKSRAVTIAMRLLLDQHK